MGVGFWGPEGYCRHCNRVEPLDESGMITAHKVGFADPGECEGSRTKPPKLIPRTVRKNAFKTIKTEQKPKTHEGERG